MVSLERKKKSPTKPHSFTLSVYILRCISLVSKRLPLRLYYTNAAISLSLSLSFFVLSGGPLALDVCRVDIRVCVHVYLHTPTTSVFIVVHVYVCVNMCVWTPSVPVRVKLGGMSASALRWLLVVASPENTEQHRGRGRGNKKGDWREHVGGLKD